MTHFVEAETREQVATKTALCEGCNTLIAKGKNYMRVSVVEDLGRVRERSGKPTTTARVVLKYHVTCWEEG